ncbi:MAG: hypothetical protein Q9182_002110 [Xanthomendoza sp. 2 TL-2023]
MPHRQEEAYHHPSAEFVNLDEFAAPLPVEAEHPSQQPLALEVSDADQAGLQKIQDSPGEEEYDLPNDYSNLDEVKAPSPVASPEIGRKQGYLDARRSSIAQSHQLSRHGSSRYGHSNSQPGGVPSPPFGDFLSDKPTPSTRHQQASRFATELYTISYLIFFSIFGTLARLGIQTLTVYPGAPIATGVLWANVAGSFIIGFLSEDQKLFAPKIWTTAPPSAFRTTSTQNRPQHSPSRHDPEQQHPPPRLPPSNNPQFPPSPSNKRTIPLYIGLTTGFCGSLTSFSSFIRDAFLALSNTLPVPISHTSSSPPRSSPSNLAPRNGGYSFLALLSIIITTISLCISALIVGAHFALAVQRFTPSLTSRLPLKRTLDSIMVLLGWGTWLGAIFMAIWPPDRLGGASYNGKAEHWRGSALFALVFAPLGCLSRFYISILLNSKIKSFPLGTFTINMLGTVAEGMFWDLQHTGRGGLVGCQVLQGMMDGFCGAATTVSTWVIELKTLRRGHAWIYGGVSVCVGVGILVGVMGGVVWGQGVRAVVCTG